MTDRSTPGTDAPSADAPNTGMTGTEMPGTEAQAGAPAAEAAGADAQVAETPTAGARTVEVRPVAAGDRGAWAALYRGYRDFYGKPHDEAIFERVWGWLLDPSHESRGLLALVDGAPVAVAHFRRFARPIDGATALYLDDLFTAPEARGTGAASAVIAHLEEVGRAEGAVLLRWITADSNATARRLYDRLATQTPWVTYDVPL